MFDIWIRAYAQTGEQVECVNVTGVENIEEADNIGKHWTLDVAHAYNAHIVNTIINTYNTDKKVAEIFYSSVTQSLSWRTF